MRRLTPTFVWYPLVAALAFAAYGQSLTDKLEEEQSFYLNYGKEPYAKLKIEKDVVGHYDGFGAHIVDGVHIYTLSAYNENLSNEEVEDSVLKSSSNEFQKNDFYEKFSNLVVTQDAIGGVKTSFLIGDQITTKFTPLTFNKTNFKGVRWDWWSSNLKFSALLSRTRPGWTSTMKSDGTGNSYVEYPITEASFPESYYGRGIKGDQDFTNVSPYGDYDFLWALHAENTIANKVDVGLTLINHHTNDVKKGPSFLKGDLPDSLMPNFIHFEFYDLTPSDTLDAGVFVEDVQMFVNGTGVTQQVKPLPAYQSTFRRVFVGDKDNVLLPRQLPLARPQNGPVPVIVEFACDPKYWGGASRPNRIYFKYTVAGNYMVFVSTDRQIPLCIDGTYNPQRREVDYFYPTRSVGAIYDAGLPVNATPTDVSSDERYYSTTYFGEYIAQSPRKIAVSDAELSQAVAECNTQGGWARDEAPYNHRVYTYEFNINVSSGTYAFNFRGELLGIKFSGELAYDRMEDMLPGSGDDGRTTTNKWAGLFKAERPIGKQFGVNGELYYISPEWRTSMNSLRASQYFNQTNYKASTQVMTLSSSGTIQTSTVPSVPDYEVYPRPLDRSWQNIEDNDDGDPFVDNEPRRYPADLDADYQRDNFYNDGTLRPNTGEMEKLTVPSGMVVPYDDPDGVVASKNDKNLNGVPDYKEDFLLFSSDPPVFDLGIDLNNNGSPDYEDDDLLPDFFSEPGRSVGAVVTGDGIRTLGIRGVNLNVRWTPVENGNLDLGIVWESVVDRDFDLENTAGDDLVEGDMDGRSIVGYLTFKRDILKRSQGVQAEYGGEVRYVRDAIRNDYVRSIIARAEEQIDASYEYQLDPVAYRNAVVGNILGGFTYTNIRNFEYGVRGKIGGEYHMALEDPVWEPAFAPSIDGYNSEWGTYDNRAVFECHAVNRLQYRIHFSKEYEGWKRVFNVLNRLEIIPQYKLHFSMRKELMGPSETMDDPRDIRKDLEMDYDGDGKIDETLDNVGPRLDTVDAVSKRWDKYARNNTAYLLSVPLLRVDFKVAENTKLQLGYQWLREYDIISPESNLSGHAFLAQIVSKASYKGYSVTFFLGGKYWLSNYDVNQRDAVIDVGSMYDRRGYEFFAKIFSGI